MNSALCSNDLNSVNLEVSCLTAENVVCENYTECLVFRDLPEQLRILICLTNEV